MTRAPRCPSDPRPNNRPYFIAAGCPEHGIPLVLADSLKPPDGPIWHDEWACPKCWAEKPPAERGVFLDWPERALERLRR